MWIHFFTNIPLEETINICIKSIYNQNNSVEVLNKSEFIELLSLATKKSYFIFNEFLYKQIYDVGMGSPLGSTLADAFLCFYEKKGFNNILRNLNKFIIEDTYMKFLYVLGHMIILLNFEIIFNKCHPDMTFSFEEEKKF